TFGYRLTLRKSKKIAWIGHPEWIESINRQKLENSGIYFYESLAEFQENLKLTNMAAWQIIVIEPGALEENMTRDELNRVIYDMPFRILYNAVEDAPEFIKGY